MTPIGVWREKLVAAALPRRGKLSSTGVRREIEGVWADAGDGRRDMNIDQRRRRFIELMEKRIASGQPRRTEYRRAAIACAKGNLWLMEEACRSEG